MSNNVVTLKSWLEVAQGIKKLEVWATAPTKKFDDIFSRLDSIHERDRRRDRRTAKTALTHSVAR